MGFTHEASDLAQESVLIMLERNMIPRIMNRIVIDAARRVIGDPRYPGWRPKVKTVSLDEIRRSRSRLCRQIF